MKNRKLLRVAAFLVCVSLLITMHVFADGVWDAADAGTAARSVDPGNQTPPSVEDGKDPEPGDNNPDGDGQDPDEGNKDPNGDGQDPDEGDPDPDEGNKDPNGDGQDPDEGDQDPNGDGQDPDEGDQDPDGDGQNPDEGNKDPDGDGQDPDGDGQDPDEGDGSGNTDGDAQNPDDGKDPDGEPEDEAPEEADMNAEAVHTILFLDEEYLAIEIANADDLRLALGTNYGANGSASLYLKLTDHVDMGTANLTPNPSVGRVVVDGDNGADGRFTLSENGILYASEHMSEVQFRNLHIAGKREQGLFYGENEWRLTYRYTDVSFTGPQMIRARGSDVYLHNVTAKTVASSLTLAHEVVEARNITLSGSIHVTHGAIDSVFWPFGDYLRLEEDCEVVVDVVVTNNAYVVHPDISTGSNAGDLILEAGASFVITGTPQRFTRVERLRSIQLGQGAEIDWSTSNPSGDHLVTLWNDGTSDKEAIRLERGARMSVSSTGSAGRGLISVNSGSVRVAAGATLELKTSNNSSDYLLTMLNDGKADSADAIRLERGAQMSVVSDGAVAMGLLSVRAGSVYIDPGARMELRAGNYTAAETASPIQITRGNLTVGGGERAVFLADVTRSSGSLKSENGLVEFGASDAQFHIGANAAVYLHGSKMGRGLVCFSATSGSFRVDQGAVAILRAGTLNPYGGVVGFVGSGGRVQIDAPDYLELSSDGGRPFGFGAGGNTVDIQNVGQINHWAANASTYLDGGNPDRRWLAQEGGFSVSTPVGQYGNGLSIDRSGGLDDEWLTEVTADNFQWKDVSIFSAGRVAVETDEVGYDAVSGRLTAPNVAGSDAPGSGSVRLDRAVQGGHEALSGVFPADPAFTILPDQSFLQSDELSILGEYRYVFERIDVAVSGPPLSFSVPSAIRFEQTQINPSDVYVRALAEYEVQVLDRRAPTSNRWRVQAAFSGFVPEQGGRPLDSTLILRSVELLQGGRDIETGNGNESFSLTPQLFVPGGTAQEGSYRGTITWTLTDAP